MKLRTLACGFICGAGSALLASYAVSQEYQQPSPDEMSAMMEKAAALMKPGPGHERLRPFIGEWDKITRVWMEGPGGQPMESKGTCTNEWILDGRFVLTRQEGEMIWFDETAQMKPIKTGGCGLTGYDNHRNMYVGCWADNISTHLLTYKGNADRTGKVFTYYGEMDEPMMGVTGRYVRYVTRVLSDDRHVFEVYDLHAGEDYKVVEIEYLRKK